MLLIGRTDIYDATSNTATGAGFENAYKFPALGSGVLNELRFRTGDGNSGGGVLKLGIYADAAGEPGALLGSGTTDVVTDNTWMSATGLDAHITAGAYYHLTVLPVGYDVYYNEHPVYTGDNPQKYSSGGPYTTLQDPWPGTDSAWDEAGAIGFHGIGTGSGPVSTAPQELSFTLCDLDGETVDQLTALADGDGFTVTINEARIGACTISVDDEIAAPPREARHVIRVVYGDAIGINGIVGSYRVTGSTGRMTIPLRDSLLRLERRELRFGHSSVDDGFTRDGRGIRQIFSDIEPSPGGAHPNGIVIDGGPNTIANDSHITHATRGVVALDPITAYTSSEGGGDIELVPVDERHPPTSRAWESGDLVELATWAFQGIDRTDPTSSDFLVFDYPGNLQDFTAGPDVEAMCNYAVAVANGGEIDADDTDYRRLATAASWALDGILERWEAIDVGDQATGETLADYKTRVRELLLARARYLVKQYATAPAVIELLLPADRDGTPAWGRDYGVGDRVHVDLERGWWSYVGDVRVMSVQVARFGASGFATQTLQVIPVGAADPVDDTETGG